MDCRENQRFSRNDVKTRLTIHNSRLTKAAFTLAETLIVIGIIGVVAALTLPNLNHATGDKETVTRVMKAYSMLNEANDRAIAIYGPVSTWTGCGEYGIQHCWLKRVSEFMKISKSCDRDQGVSCDALKISDWTPSMAIQLPDGITFSSDEGFGGCDYRYGNKGGWAYFDDICVNYIDVDINGPTKGKNDYGYDIFGFALSDSLGVIPYQDMETPWDTLEIAANDCISEKWNCTWWVLDYGNLDYLKADEDGNCNDSNIVLDGVNNTSCH